MAPLHPREGSSLQDFINAVDLEQRGPDGWREVTLPREQYEAMLYQILVVDGGRTSSIVRKGCRRVNRKLDAQNHALVRGPTSSRSGGRGHVASRPMTVADLRELRSDAPKLREPEPRFFTGAYL